MKEGSLETVYQLHMNDIYRYLLQLSGHPQTAEDLVQETFIKAYEFLESYKGERVRPWLFRVAYNSYIDWYRKEKRQVQTDPSLLNDLYQETYPSPKDHYIRKEKFIRWFNAINSLTEKSRQVILLRDYYDLTYEDIAKILNITLPNVKVTLFRARQKIREVIKDEL